MIELLLKLEMSLWINETRNNPGYLDRILHNDFQEFAKSGRIYSKNDILKNSNFNIEAVFPFKKLNVKQIDEQTFLITYQAELVENERTIVSNRSSIWIGNKNFQLIFHQGTLVNEDFNNE